MVPPSPARDESIRTLILRTTPSDLRFRWPEFVSCLFEGALMTAYEEPMSGAGARVYAGDIVAA